MIRERTVARAVRDRRRAHRHAGADAPAAPAARRARARRRQRGARAAGEGARGRRRDRPTRGGSCALSPAIDEHSRTLRIEAEVPNRDGTHPARRRSRPADIVVDAARRPCWCPPVGHRHLRRRRKGAASSTTARWSRSACELGRREGRGRDPRRASRRRAWSSSNRATCVDGQAVSIRRERTFTCRATVMQTLADALHPPTGLRQHDRARRWSSSARPATSASASIASRRSTCRPCACGRVLPGASPEEVEVAGLASGIEEVVNTVEGIDGAALASPGRARRS